jgi:parallel beta-helix repeat protein
MVFANVMHEVLLGADENPPIILVASPLNQTYSSSTIWFNATANEAVDTWIVNYNGTNITLGSINTTLEVEDGFFNLKIYANDTSGNWGLNDSVWFGVESGAEVTVCRELNAPNSVYTLQNDVTSVGTCFNILANNVTLDCGGHMINYSIGGVLGYGVNVSGYNWTTVRNCVVNEGVGETSFKHGIRFNEASEGNIVNNSISTIGGAADGISLWLSSNNSIINNSISTEGSASTGIYFSSSSGSFVFNNFILTEGNMGHGIYFELDTNNNSFIGMNVSTSYSNTYAVYVYGTTHNFTMNDSVLGSVDFFDFYRSGEGDGGEWNLTNVSRTGGGGINATFEPGANGTLNYGWWIDANVSASGSALSGASVVVQDKDSNLFGNELTDASGRARVSALEYTRSGADGATWVWYSNYAVNVSKEGYTDEVRSYNLSLTGNVWVDVEMGEEEVSDDILIDSCQDLDVENAVYKLTGNVSSEGTCFNILANNVTLDCQGHEINYSSAGVLGYGVNVDGYNWTTVRGCVIREGTSATDSKHGIFFNNSNNGAIENNTISTNGSYGYGISLSSSSNSNSISNNTISTNGSYGYGINLFSSSNSSISNNSILTNGSSGYGILLYSSSNSTISNNTISTNGSYGYGISLSSSSNSNSISNNTISTNGSYGYGINLFSSSNSSISNNTISTNGSTGQGIILYSSSNLTVSDNTISTNGSSGFGISLFSSSNSNSILNNTILTNGSSGRGIYLESSFNSTISSNTISTYGGNGHGISLRISSNSNSISNNSISTTGEYSHGIYFQDSTNNNTFSWMRVFTNNVNAHAVRVNGTTHNFTMIDSVLNSANVSDFYRSFTGAGGIWNLTNVSRADGEGINVGYEASRIGTLNYGWWIDANVTNASSGGVFEGASVVVRDKDSVIRGNELTDASGRARLSALEYTRSGADGATWVWYSNYSLEVSKFGYQRNTTSYNLSLTKNVWADVEMGEGVSVEEITDCQVLNRENTIYKLQNDVSSTGTCFNVRADNVTLDCQGFNVTYNTAGGSTQAGVNATDGMIARNGLVVQNCVLVKPTNLQTAGYGILLTRFSNSTLINNTIYTNGTTNNYGIYLTTASDNNLIDNNTIYSSGTSTGNAGIYLLTNTSNNVISNNVIFTSGTTTGYGVWISGVTLGSNNNSVLYNNITTSGTGASNFGVYLYRNVSSSYVIGNNVTTSGTTTNHGIILEGTTDLVSDNNLISLNNVQTFGSTAGSNYGIYLNTNANNNNVTENNVSTNGATTNNWGVYILGTAALTSNNNLVFGNNISTNGTTACYGVYLLNNANYNNITGNFIRPFGTTTAHGIYVSGATSRSENNEISFNDVATNGSAGTSNNYGIVLYRNANYNNVFGNNISTSGTASDYGILLEGTTNLPVENNTVSMNNIATSGRTGGTNVGIYLNSFISSNNLTLNNISTSGATTNNYGIYIAGSSTLNSNGNFVYMNNISTSGTTGGHGVYILTNANENIVRENNISTSGSGTTYGVWVSGSSFTADRNEILYNNITMSATGATNYGIYLYRNVSFTNITGNEINTRGGTTTNHGIFGLASAGYVLENNTVDSNSFTTGGTAGAITSYGIYFSGANLNNITNNNVTTYGTTNNWGIYILGAAGLSANNNNIFGNDVQAAGTTTNNHGIFISTNAEGNNVSFNSVRTSGTNTNYGVYILGTTTLTSNYNTVFSNNISTLGTGTSNHGIFVLRNSSYNLIESNNILTSGTTNNGIYLNLSDYNVLRNNNVSGVFGYYLQRASHNDIRDCVFTSGTTNDVFVHSDILDPSLNNSLVNCSYVTESVSGVGNNLIRKWYFDAVVNNSEGYLEGARVGAGNVSGSEVFGAFTDGNGRIERQELAEYVRTVGARTLATPHLVYTVKAGYETNFSTYNLTAIRMTNGFANVMHEVLLGADENPPIISVASPLNQTYGTSTIWFNATANEAIDTWILNYNGTNVTLSNINSSFELEDGSYQVLLYANDTSGFWGLNDSVWFRVETGTDLTACRELNIENAVYTLQNDVTSTGTCFNILANNVTLDCQGFEINYSSAGVLGYGVNVSGYNWTTVRNCVIKEGVSMTDSKHGIYFGGVNNGSIENNTITITGGWAYGISLLSNSNSNSISNNSISTNGSYGYGISLSSSSNSNSISNNTISTTGSLGHGVYFYSASTNNNSFSGMMVFTNNSDAHAVRIHGLVVGGDIHNFTIEDSVLNSTNVSDFYRSGAGAGGVWNLTNVTRANGNEINVGYEASRIGTLNYGWWIDANVSASGSALEGASVIVRDKDSNLFGNELTDASGRARVSALEYTRSGADGATWVWYSNYAVNVSKEGYSNASAIYNLSLERNVWGNFELSEEVVNSPPQITNARVNAVSPVEIDSEVKINATVTDTDGNLQKVILQVVPPVSAVYNVTPTGNGGEYYYNVVLSEVGSWQFKFYANDSLGEKVGPVVAEDLNGNNQIGVERYGRLVLSQISPAGSSNQPQNQTFNSRVNVTCDGESGAVCGLVSATIRYNSSGFMPDTNLPTSSSSPFYVTGTNPYNCGVMSRGDVCVVEFSVNATGEIGRRYNLDVSASSNVSSISSNITDYFTLKVVYPILSIVISNELANIDFGASLNPGTQNNPAINNTNDAYNAQCNHPGGFCNLSIRGEAPLKSGINVLDYGNVSWGVINDAGFKNSLSNYLTVLNSTLPHLAVQKIYFWVDIPSHLVAGDYRGNFTLYAESV